MVPSSRHPWGSETLTSPCLALCLCFKLFPAECGKPVPWCSDISTPTRGQSGPCWGMPQEWPCRAARLWPARVSSARHVSRIPLFNTKPKIVLAFSVLLKTPCCSHSLDEEIPRSGGQKPTPVIHTKSGNLVWTSKDATANNAGSVWFCRQRWITVFKPPD